MLTAKRASALLPVVLVPLLTTVPLAGGHTQTAAAARNGSITSARDRSAATFAAEFVGATNQYAKQHAMTDRISNAHCVEAAPSRYMCSYVNNRRASRTCHLMQARWNPQQSPTITITLAGRTDRCGTLRDAIHSLH